MPNNVNLERLQTFVVAARAPTFAAAARVRGVSVSAVSQQVRALEGELGHQLFERIGRRVRLTVEGRALLDTTAAHLGAIDEAIGALGSRRKAVEGVVTVGSPRTFGHHWLEPRIPALLRAAPALRLRLRFDVPSVLERLLLDGELDLALLVRPPELPGIEGRLVAQEQFVAIAAPGLCGPFDEEALRTQRWLTFAGDRPMHDAWWRATFGKASKPRVDAVCEVPSLEFLLGLVARGVGLAVLPDYLVAPAIARKAVFALPVVAKKAAKNGLFLAWRSSTILSARFEAVRLALSPPDKGS